MQFSKADLILLMLLCLSLFRCTRSEVKDPMGNNGKDQDSAKFHEIIRKEAYDRSDLNEMSSKIDSHCTNAYDFSSVLEDSNLSEVAKEIYFNREFDINVNTDYPSLFDSLYSSDRNRRAFYFLVVSKSYGKVDGAYGEMLGYKGAEFVKNETKLFLDYFIHGTPFTLEYLDSWAGIVSIELNLVKENQDPDIVNKYVAMLEENCKDCSEKQSGLLKRFVLKLREYSV